jgi:hypothetical protein
LHADLVSLGYEGSYNRVAAFAREWKAARLREQQTSGRGAYVPLAFQPGEAFQFDWSEDWAIIGGERTKLQVGDCPEFCVWSHNSADGGRLWQSRRARWTSY